MNRCLFAALAFLIASSGYAQKDPPNNILVIASSNNFPPINFLNESGDLDGYAREISTAVAKASNLQVQYIHSPYWNDVLGWLEKGEAQAIHDTAYSKIRDKFLDYSDPILEMEEVIIVRNDQYDINSFTSLNKKTVACVENHISHLYLKQFPTINCYLVNTPAEGLASLISGNVDALVYPKPIALYMAQQLGATNKLKVVGNPIRKLQWSMVVKEGNIKLLKKLNSGIQSIKASGEYDRIYDRWLGDSVYSEYSEKEVTYIIILATVATAAFSLIVGLLIYANRIKVTRDALVVSDNRYETLIEALPQRIFHKDINLNYVTCNESYARDLGIDRESIEGKNDFQVNSQHASQQQRDDKYVIQSGATLEANEKRFVGESEHIFHTIKYPLYDNSGNIKGILGIYWDNTDNYIQRKALYESELMFRQLAENIEEIFWISSLDWQHIYYINPTFEKVWGKRREHVYSNPNTWQDSIHPQDRKAIEEWFTKLRKIKDVLVFPEYRVIQPDGAIRWVLTRAYPVRNDNNIIYRVAGYTEDITARKESEDSLRKSNKTLETIINTDEALIKCSNEHELLDSVCNILVSTEEYKLAWVAYKNNDESQSIRVMSSAGADTDYLNDIDISWGDNPLGRGPTGTAIRTGTTQVNQSSKSNISFSPWKKAALDHGLSSSIALPLFVNEVCIGALNIYSQSKNGLSQNEIELLQDLTDNISYGLSSMRTRNNLTDTQETLSTTLNHLKSITESIPDALFYTTADLRLVSWNKALVLLTGYNEEELADQSLFSLIDEKDHGQIQQELTKPDITTFVSLNTLLSTSEGNSIPLNLRLTRLTNEFGATTGLIGIARNLTQELCERDEKEQIQKQLQQAQKMEAVGQLTGGIAHDFNNILTIIMGYVGLIQDSPKKIDPEIKSFLKEVHHAGIRAKDLVAQLLAFSRTDSTNKEALAVDILLKEITKMVKATFPSSLEIKTDIQGNISDIKANPVQIHQCITNLILNARDASKEHGSITISLTEEHDIQGSCSSCHETFHGDYLKVSVKDHGEGMSKQQMQKIFEPFFTTKPQGKGTGMGLPMVHGIIHKHDGHICVESSPLGSDFQLLLPLNNSVRASVKVAQPVITNKSPGRTEQKILVIDDEESITGFLKEFLGTQGYLVEPFTSSKEALEYYKLHHKNVDLVITDQTMPDLTGKELAIEILNIDPEQAIILCTGYSAGVTKESAMELGIGAFMEKPIENVTLLNTIHSLLEKETASS